MKPSLRWYLLGDGTAAEREAVALRVAADADSLDELDFAESELIEAFVAGELSGIETEKFHAKFLIDEERRERLAMAKGLTAMGKEMRTRQMLAWAGGVALVALVGWLWMSQSGVVREGAVLALYLNSQRSVEMPPTLALSGASNPVVLELHCPEIAPEGIATVSRVGETEPVLKLRMAPAESQIVRVPVPKSSLGEGEYVVVLEAGKQFRADFVFRVSR